MSSLLLLDSRNPKWAAKQARLHAALLLPFAARAQIDILQGSRPRESQPQQPGRPMPSLSVSMPLILITSGLYLWTMRSSKAKIVQLVHQLHNFGSLVRQSTISQALETFSSPSLKLVLSFLVNTTSCIWSWTCTWSTPPATLGLGLPLGLGLVLGQRHQLQRPCNCYSVGVHGLKHHPSVFDIHHRFSYLIFVNLYHPSIPQNRQRFCALCAKR